MTVRRRLTLIVILVALAPLALASYSSLRVHREAYDGKLTELRANAAIHAASVTDALLESASRSLRALVDSIHWAGLTDEERKGAQWMLYQQSADVGIVAVLDEQGLPQGTSVYRADDSDPKISQHPKISSEELAAFAESIPFSHAQEAAVAIGLPLVPKSGGAPLVSIALAVPDASSGKAWVVAAYLSLRGPCDKLSEGLPSGTSVTLVDSSGVILCADDSALAGTMIPTALQERLGGDSTLTYTDLEGGEIFVAQASTFAGWRVVVREPRSAVMAPGRRIMMQMLFWVAVGLIGAIAAGMILARSINTPIGMLAAGAKALESGKLEHRIPLASNDEFGSLSKAFNSMADEIAQWNKELKTRVEEQTRDLREAQDLLIDSKKQAAIATLGAGIAHEINNPLTGVLSMIQIAKGKIAAEPGREKVVGMLEKAENEARRIREIVQRMHALAQSNNVKGADFKLDQVVQRSLDAARDGLVNAEIVVTNEIPADVATIFGQQTEMQEAVGELIKNAMRAMRQSATKVLTLRANVVGKDLASFEVSDTGCGIAEEHMDKVFEPFFTAKDDWNSKGLGLSLVQRIVTDHKGTIRIRNNDDGGVSVRVVMPTASQRAHLE